MQVSTDVRAEIMKCSTTECPQHKKGSLSADLYAKASKSASHFLANLLCPQIERSELAVKVADGPSNHAAELEIAKIINIKAAIDKKTKQEENFKASNACRGTNASKLKKERQQVPLPGRADEAGFSWYKKACCELRCDSCGISRLHNDDAVHNSAIAAADTAIEEAEDLCNCV